MDPVAKGSTSETTSLASLYIYKNATEVTKIKEDGSKEVYIEQGKLVCWWTGRFNDLKNTHERIEMMLELYNAWCVIERNVFLFIQYMQMRNKQRFLATKDQMLFVKDVNTTKRAQSQEYGWLIMVIFLKIRYCNMVLILCQNLYIKNLKMMVV